MTDILKISQGFLAFHSHGQQTAETQNVFQDKKAVLIDIKGMSFIFNECFRYPVSTSSGRDEAAPIL